jgi:hypothetical protein
MQEVIDQNDACIKRLIASEKEAKEENKTTRAAVNKVICSRKSLRR